MLNLHWTIWNNYMCVVDRKISHNMPFMHINWLSIQKKTFFVSKFVNTYLYASCCCATEIFNLFLVFETHFEKTATSLYDMQFKFVQAAMTHFQKLCIFFVSRQFFVYENILFRSSNLFIWHTSNQWSTWNSWKRQSN